MECEWAELIHLVLEETKREKDRIIADKEALIAHQNKKIENMAVEFTAMLKVRAPTLHTRSRRH
jgi:hypothetical protein